MNWCVERMSYSVVVFRRKFLVDQFLHLMVMMFENFHQHSLLDLYFAPHKQVFLFLAVIGLSSSSNFLFASNTFC